MNGNVDVNRNVVYSIRSSEMDVAVARYRSMEIFESRHVSWGWGKR